MELTSIILFSAAFTAICVLFYHRRAKNDLPLPPGPPQLPIIGNIHQTPAQNPWRTYREWHQKYGPIMSLKYGQKTIILLGTHEVVRDLLDKRSDIYSSRPKMIVAGDCMSKGFSTALLPYGKKWKTHHSIQGAFLSPRMCGKYHELQDMESKQLLHEMLGSSNFSESFHRYALSITYTLAYGKRLRHGQDADLLEIDALTEKLSKTVNDFRGLLVEAYPFLNHLPRFLTPWKTMGDEYFQRVTAFFTRSMARAEQMESWNWTKEALSRKASQELSRTELSYTVGMLLEASVETTPTVLEVLVMACVLHPAVVARAQKELDTIVGQERLPSFDDMPDLRYINALVSEVLRWRPAVPLGFPHACTQDDEYMGYRIPKDIPVFATQWALDLDPDLFEDPFEFKPERWLDNPGLPTAAFGFGRRVCPGKHLARNSLLMITARLLWAFDISHACDENGQRIEIDPWDMAQGTVSGPTPFKASFTVRSPNHRAIIEKEWDAAEKCAEVYLAKIQGAS